MKKILMTNHHFFKFRSEYLKGADFEQENIFFPRLSIQVINRVEVCIFFAIWVGGGDQHDPDTAGWGLSLLILNRTTLQAPRCAR